MMQVSRALNKRARANGHAERKGGRERGKEGGTHLSDDILQRPSFFTLLRHHQIGIHSPGLEAFVLLRREVQVFKAEGGVGGVVPSNTEFALEVVDEADAGT